MPSVYDLSTLDPKEAERILRARESKRREYQRNRDIILSRNRAWRAANPVRVLETAAAWREANAEHVRQYKRTWYERNAETIKARQAKRQRELSTPGVLRTVFLQHTGRDLGLTAKDVPDELLETIRLTTLIKRELKQRKQVST